MKKEYMNLQESKKRHLRDFEEKKRKEEKDKII